jgi:hypothetical protein
MSLVEKRSSLICRIASYIKSEHRNDIDGHSDAEKLD